MAESQNDHPNINKNVHPPIVALIFIAIAYVAKWAIPIPLVLPNVVRIIGFAFVIIGFLLGLIAFSEFNKAHTTLNPHGSVSSIITSGIYRFTRNPIYLGFLLMLIGFPLNSGTLWGLILAPVFIYSMNSLVIEKEEAYLEKKFRDVYTSYKSRVRRWL